MGARLLRSPTKLARLVSGIAEEIAPFPLTVKIRTGMEEGKVNCLQVAQEMEAAGAAAVTLHGRTMKARYSKPADWAMIDGVARGLGIPLIGNGDLLTAYDISRRFAESGCSAVMVGKGALVAPWIFKEWKDGASWFPTTEERVEVYHTLVRYMKEHFGDDEKGRKKAFYFLPWHL